MKARVLKHIASLSMKCKHLVLLVQNAIEVVVFIDHSGGVVGVGREDDSRFLIVFRVLFK